MRSTTSPPMPPAPTPQRSISRWTICRQRIDQVSPQLGPTFDGLTRLSRAINSRDQHAGRTADATPADVTAILSDRSQQLNTLILNADDLLDILVQRRQVIVELLANTSAVAKQLTRTGRRQRDSRSAPTLDKLNSVTAMLEKNRDNIAKALPGLAKYEITNGEALSSGAYYNSFVANLSPATVPATVLRLRIGLPPRSRCRPTTGQRGSARRDSRSRTTGFRNLASSRDDDVARHRASAGLAVLLTGSSRRRPSC